MNPLTILLLSSSVKEFQMQKDSETREHEIWGWWIIRIIDEVVHKLYIRAIEILSLPDLLYYVTCSQYEWLSEYSFCISRLVCLL